VLSSESHSLTYMRSLYNEIYACSCEKRFAFLALRNEVKRRDFSPADSSVYRFVGMRIRQRKLVSVQKMVGFPLNHSSFPEASLTALVEQEVILY
jgi:hypothetical protein